MSRSVRWEIVVEDREGDRNDQHLVTTTKRLAVPGGWLYCTTTHEYVELVRDGAVQSVALAFVPQPLKKDTA